MAERFSTTHDVPLVGDVDLPRVLAEMPDDYTVKGMFFTRYVAALGEEWEKIHAELRAPAKHGRYHAFESYPTKDYLRLFDRVARARFPGSAREAYRLLGRGEVEVFANSTLGKVTFSMLKDPSAALLRYPEVFSVVQRGPEMSARKAGERKVVISSPRYLGAIYALMGILEGLVLAFDALPALDVNREDDGKTTFEVTWTT